MLLFYKRICRIRFLTTYVPRWGRFRLIFFSSLYLNCGVKKTSWCWCYCFEFFLGNKKWIIYYWIFFECLTFKETFRIHSWFPTFSRCEFDVVWVVFALLGWILKKSQSLFDGVWLFVVFLLWSFCCLLIMILVLQCISLSPTFVLNMANHFLLFNSKIRSHLLSSIGGIVYTFTDPKFCFSTRINWRGFTFQVPFNFFGGNFPYCRCDWSNTKN